MSEIRMILECPKTRQVQFIDIFCTILLCINFFYRTWSNPNLRWGYFTSLQKNWPKANVSWPNFKRVTHSDFSASNHCIFYYTANVWNPNLPKSKLRSLFRQLRCLKSKQKCPNFRRFTKVSKNRILVAQLLSSFQVIDCSPVSV